VTNKLILGLTISLALTLTPATGSAVPSKEIKKKSSSVKSSKSTKSSTKKSKILVGSSKRRSQLSGRQEAEDYDSPVSAPSPSKAGVAETPPLMRVIPQRDGRFLLEPLTPKKNYNVTTGPTSQLDQKKNEAAPGGRGYHLYEPWSFQELILSLAKGYQGARYSRGGNFDTGYATDCSGFVQYIYNGFQIKLPRSSAEQAQVGKTVTHTMDFSKLVPGDLLFFRRGGRGIGHAGIYLGEGKMIHASNHRNGVIITDLRQGYYQDTFVVAKRVFEVTYPK
jgi:cell wall-associated NlpC family hydrolase